MVLLGRDTYVFDGIQGKTCNVQPFDPSIGTAKSIPIVDGAIAYECQYTHKVYILILRNALYLDTLNHSLLPPFILREAGIDVNDVPKIHCDNPTAQDHSIYIS